MTKLPPAQPDLWHTPPPPTWGIFYSTFPTGGMEDSLPLSHPCSLQKILFLDLDQNLMCSELHEKAYIVQYIIISMFS